MVTEGGVVGEIVDAVVESAADKEEDVGSHLIVRHLFELPIITQSSPNHTELSTKSSLQLIHL